MRCPKCGFFGPDSLDICKKCGRDLFLEKEKLGLGFFPLQAARTSREVKEGRAAAAKVAEESPAPLKGERTLADQRKATPQALRTERIPSPQMPARAEKTGDSQLLSSGPSDSDFLFAPADDEIPPQAPSNKTKERVLFHTEETNDDFEFPTFVSSDLTKSTTAGQESDLTTLSYPDAGVPESFDLLRNGEKTLTPPSLEPPGGEQARSKTLEDEQLGVEKLGGSEESNTTLLTPEEIEQILKTDLARQSERVKSRKGDSGKTQLLDENEIASLLESLENKPLKPGKRP